MDDRIGVLFVCMGNICRSPMAESVFRHLVARAELEASFDIESAGTHSYHLGHRPHPHTQAELRANGIDVGDAVSRLVEPADFDRFDYVVAMDRDNLANLRQLAGDAHDRLSLLLDHAADADEDEVPDPYYEGGYDTVFRLVSAGCEGLLATIVREAGLHAA